MMLIGQKDLSIDEKGRLVLPSSYRDRFAGGVCYVSLGLDGCICLYPQDSYEAIAQKYMSYNEFDDTARKVKRTFLANTFDVQIDSHNRILLPKALLTKTATGRKVTIIGMIDHLELWDSERYEKQEAENEESYASDAQSLANKD
jgi:MraZ protein